MNNNMPAPQLKNDDEIEINFVYMTICFIVLFVMIAATSLAIYGKLCSIESQLETIQIEQGVEAGDG